MPDSNTEIKTESPVGHTLAYFSTVAVVDDSIAVHIHKNHVTGDCVGLEQLSGRINICCHLLLCLENTVSAPAVKEWERLSVFRTGNHTQIAMYFIVIKCTALVTQTDKFIAVVRAVDTGIEIKFTETVVE